MKSKRVIALSLVLPLVPIVLSGQTGLRIVFEDTEGPQFTTVDKRHIVDIITESERGVRTFLPTLSSDIQVTVVLVDRDLRGVGGVSGRADAPGKVLVEISTRLDGGIAEAVNTGLSRTVFHEFHHLVRGWTISENQFGPGIGTAAVNEGLADVFAQHYTGVILEEDGYPDEVDAWVAEILALPTDADYGEWMFEHPDGRRAIGYHAGQYIVHQAMASSGKTVLELGELTPAEILSLAGF